MATPADIPARPLSPGAATGRAIDRAVTTLSDAVADGEYELIDQLARLITAHAALKTAVTEAYARRHNVNGASVGSAVLSFDEETR
jgi:hypothetical protein